MLFAPSRKGTPLEAEAVVIQKPIPQRLKAAMQGKTYVGPEGPTPKQ
jgi:hypothetical protein